MAETKYEPFGPEWKAAINRMKKSEIIDFLAKSLKEIQILKEKG